MKAFLVLVFTLCSVAASAQSISLGEYADSSCPGDVLFIPYNVTGTFNSDNMFNLHLSDINGSLTHFSIIGSNSTPNSAFRFTLPSLGTKWRVQVASTSPYMLSDTSRNLASFARPGPGIGCIRQMTGMEYGNYKNSPAVGMIGDAYKFMCYSGRDLPKQHDILWQFDPDAQVTVLSDSEKMVSYTTPGWKTVTVTAEYSFGCPGTKGWRFYVGTCRPKIPLGARIVDANGVQAGNDSVFWVKPGITFNLGNTGRIITIFAEPGSAVGLNSSCICYAKSGASISPPNATNFTVFANGVMDTFTCPDLQFDYSSLGVAPDPIAPLSISVDRNMLTVHSDAQASVRIVDILGAEVMHANSASVDLSTLKNDAYFAIVESGKERLIQRVAVVH